jgi:hypothetical protein
MDCSFIKSTSILLTTEPFSSLTAPAAACLAEPLAQVPRALALVVQEMLWLGPATLVLGETRLPARCSTRVIVPAQVIHLGSTICIVDNVIGQPMFLWGQVLQFFCGLTQALDFTCLLIGWVNTCIIAIYKTNNLRKSPVNADR